MHVAADQRIAGAERRKIRQAVERDVEFSGRAANLEVAGQAHDLRVEVAGVEQLQEGALWIDVGNDDVGVVLIAVGERHAAGPPAAHQDALDTGADP